MPEINFSHFFRDSKAFFIGVNDYQSPAISNLHTPANDVAKLSTVLKDLHGFKVEPVSGTIVHANPLINPEAKTVFDFLAHLTVSKEDRVIIYFAGHGIAIDSEGSPEGYLLMADAVPGQWDSFVKMSDIMLQLKKICCKHLLLVLDCCYAGAFRWASSMRSPGEDVPRTIYFERFQQYAGNKAWQILTSSAHDQKAIDTLALKLGQREEGRLLSPFAQVLSDALETGNADLSYGSIPPDGIITATELGYYLKEEIFRRLYNQGIQGDKQQLPMLFPVINAENDQFGKGEFVFLNPSLISEKQSIQIANRTGKNPYRGLSAYDKEDNLVFYGRQRVMNGWYDGRSRQPGLIEATEQYKLIILTGPSGIGKSSLAKAGLLSYYKGKKQLHEIRPGKTPVQTHHQLFLDLEQTSGSILLVDQYEELITATLDSRERAQFEDWLFGLMEHHLIILTIRSDFEGLFKTSPVFQVNASICRFVVPPFLRSEIEEIVVQPAAQENLEFKPEINNEKERDIFIDRIVNDAYQNPASLPLLSLALSELYRKKEGNNLLESEYEKFGGITGILEMKITEAYEGLEPHQTEQFRNLIFRMITIDSGRILKRRLYTNLAGLKTQEQSPADLFDELVFRNNEDTQDVKKIAGSLIESRLLTPGKEESGQHFIEPSHDALLKWSKLLLWLKEPSAVSDFTIQEQVQLQKSVSDVTKSYRESDTGEQAAMIKSWTKHPRLKQLEKGLAHILNKEETTFIEKVSRQNKRQALTRNIFLACISSIILLLGIFGWVQANRTANALTRNKAMLLASESEQYGATEHLAMLRQAYHIFKDPSIENKIYKLLNTYDYTNPFAIDYFKADSTIDKLFYEDKTNALIMATKDSIYVPSINSHKNIHPVPAAESNPVFNISVAENGIKVCNLHNHQAILLKENDLAGHFVDTEKKIISLLVIDSFTYYSIQLDYNLKYISHKKVLESTFASIKYFARHGYYVLDLPEASMLFSPDGNCIDTRQGAIQITGVHFINNKIVEVLQQVNPTKVCLALPNQVKGLHWREMTFESDAYTSPDNYYIRDSIFLFVINSAPRGGPGGQSTEIFICDFKTGKKNALVNTPNVLPSFSLSADRRMALAAGEDSLYVIDLVHNQTRILYLKDILASKFSGSANYFYTVCKTGIGYTTTVFDSMLTVIHESEFSEKPELVSIAPLNKYIAISYGAKALIWELKPWFNAKPWGEKLNNTNRTYLEIEEIEINKSGSFIMIDATINSGELLSPVYYIGHSLQKEVPDNDWETIKNRLLVPGSDTAIEIWTNYFTGKIKGIFYADLSTSIYYPVQKDSLREMVINMLTGNRLALTVKEGVVFQHYKAEQIYIDSFEKILLNWERRFYMDGLALVEKRSFPDGSQLVYEAGKPPRKTYDWGLPSFPGISLKNTPTLSGFVYNNTVASNDFRRRLKALTQYDITGKDALSSFDSTGRVLIFSDQGILLRNEGRLYNYDTTAGFTPEGPENIIGASLYDNAFKILMVSGNGTVYLKKTRKYMDWFLQHGYSIPLEVVRE